MSRESGREQKRAESTRYIKMVGGSEVTWTIVMEAAVTIPQMKQLTYSPSSSSSSTDSAIIQLPRSFWKQNDVKAAERKDLPVNLFKIKFLVEVNN